MNKIKVNTLPRLTYRYTHTNETVLDFAGSSNKAEPEFSDMTYVSEGGSLPDSFKGAAEELVKAAQAGRHFMINIPDGVKTALSVRLELQQEAKEFCGTFSVSVGQEAELNLIWIWDGSEAGGQIISAASYEVQDGGNLKVSILEKNLPGAVLVDQRHIILHEGAICDFASALLGGEKVIVHSNGRLEGSKSGMTETAVYAASGTQHEDLFYHLEHVGKETKSHIDVKGSLNDHAGKVFRGTLDFKHGCSGSKGDESDYAVQLSPTARNISLPLLLCREDDVMGNHASSAGQLNEQIIYYLMSRGFSREEAQRMVIESMLRPLIDRMDESLQGEVVEAVNHALDAKESL